MEIFVANPAFRTYGLCTAILAIKMLLSAVYTGTRRQASQGYINPEDARTFGGAGAAAFHRDSGVSVANFPPPLHFCP